MPWRNDDAARRHSNATYGAAWRKARLACLQRANWRCEIRTPGVCIGAAAEVDHIVSPLDGGGHDQANLRATCRPCHRARTARQGGGYRGGHRGGGDPDCQPRTDWTR